MLAYRTGLTFIHKSNISHRVCVHPSKYSINFSLCWYPGRIPPHFLVQWHAESMRTMPIPVSCPRVFLIDFEVAISFPHRTSVWWLILPTRNVLPPTRA